MYTLVVHFKCYKYDCIVDIDRWNENISTNLYPMHDFSQFKLFEIGINNSLKSDIINATLKSGSKCMYKWH